MSDNAAPRPFSPRRLLPLVLLLAGGGLFMALWRQYLSFATLSANHDWACALVARAPVISALCFVAIYAGLVAISVPGAAVLTIVGGFLFGVWFGTAYALVAATIGATAVFVAARCGLRGLLAKAGPQLRRLEAGFREDALSYLLVLRLVPLFPFWLVNLVAGATGMRLSSYLIATFFGMIPATFVYTSLGNGFAAIFADGRPPDLHALFRAPVLLPIIGLAALALVPVAYRRWRAAR